MAASVREQVLQRVESLLGGEGSPATAVYRARMDQLSGLDLPCYDIEPGAMKAVEGGACGRHGANTTTLPVTVRAIVDAAVQEDEGEDGATPLPIDDSALDPFYVFAVQQLVGFGANLNGLVDDAREDSAVTVFRPEGRDLIGIEMHFEFEFAVRRGDPTQRG